MQVVTRLQICTIQINFLLLYITSNVPNLITTAIGDFCTLCASFS